MVQLLPVLREGAELFVARGELLALPSRRALGASPARVRPEALLAVAAVGALRLVGLVLRRVVVRRDVARCRTEAEEVGAVALTANELLLALRLLTRAPNLVGRGVGLSTATTPTASRSCRSWGRDRTRRGGARVFELVGARPRGRRRIDRCEPGAHVGRGAPLLPVDDGVEARGRGLSLLRAPGVVAGVLRGDLSRLERARDGAAHHRHGARHVLRARDDLRERAVGALREEAPDVGRGRPDRRERGREVVGRRSNAGDGLLRGVGLGGHALELGSERRRGAARTVPDRVLPPLDAVRRTVGRALDVARVLDEGGEALLHRVRVARHRGHRRTEGTETALAPRDQPLRELVDGRLDGDARRLRELTRHAHERVELLLRKARTALEEARRRRHRGRLVGEPPRGVARLVEVHPETRRIAVEALLFGGERGDRIAHRRERVVGRLRGGDRARDDVRERGPPRERRLLRGRALRARRGAAKRLRRLGVDVAEGARLARRSGLGLGELARFLCEPPRLVGGLLQLRGALRGVGRGDLRQRRAELIGAELARREPLDEGRDARAGLLIGRVERQHLALEARERVHHLVDRELRAVAAHELERDFQRVVSHRRRCLVALVRGGSCARRHA